jgi:hypothetical protein
VMNGEISVLSRGFLERLEMDSAMTFPLFPDSTEKARDAF